MLSRSAAKTAPKATTPKIEKRFGELNCYNSNDNLISSSIVIVSIKSNNSIFKFKFSVEEDSFCCGMRSLGDFSIIENEGNFSEKEKIKFLKEVFEKLIDSTTKERNSSELTFMLTLINNSSCNLLRKVFSDGKIFTLVKTFVNSNSGNKNEIYISN